MKKNKNKKKDSGGWIDSASQQFHNGCVRAGVAGEYDYSIPGHNGARARARARTPNACAGGWRYVRLTIRLDGASLTGPSGRKSIPSRCGSTLPCTRVSYHAVHCEVLVLGLQLHGVGVVVADLRVARQEQTLVVHDPVKHLRR